MSVGLHTPRAMSKVIITSGDKITTVDIRKIHQVGNTTAKARTSR
jgi:hypothetical protein